MSLFKGCKMIKYVETIVKCAWCHRTLYKFRTRKRSSIMLYLTPDKVPAVDTTKAKRRKISMKHTEECPAFAKTLRYYTTTRGRH